MDLRICLNQIRTLAGQPIFSWTILGKSLAIAISRILRPNELMEQNWMNNIALCVSLCTYISDREPLACREQFINVMSSDSISKKKIGRQNILDIFRTTFSVNIGLIGHDLRNVRILHLYLTPFWPLPPTYGFHIVWRHNKITHIQQRYGLIPWLWTGIAGHVWKYHLCISRSSIYGPIRMTSCGGALTVSANKSNLGITFIL